MTRDGVIAAMIVLAVVLFALGVWAWRRRTRRDSGLAAPVGEIPTGATVVCELDGFYVATTPRDEPLERLAIRGLAFRSRTGVTVTSAGVALDLTGQPRMFVPLGVIDGVDRANVAIDRVVEPGGLVRLQWRLGETAVDTYLRAQDAGSRTLATAIAGILSPTSDPSAPTIPTGTDA